MNSAEEAVDALACTLAMLLAGIGGGGGAPAAPVARPLEVTIQDDALLLGERAPDAVRRLVAAGADRVRITASWSHLAPEPRSRRRPAFEATDPRAYPQGRFEELDRAVRLVTDAGLGVQIDVAFWAPRWAVRRSVAGAPGRQRWRPDAREYGHFVEAVARRYNGGFEDPVRRGRSLPAVRLWTTWNEPNQANFLLPQFERTRRGRWRAVSPHIYRAMHEAGYDALKRVSDDNQVLLGGLAPHGARSPGTARSMDPLVFVRALACVDPSLRPLRTRECRRFRPLRADGFAHHPYSGERPDTPSADPDAVTLADLDRLSALLDELHRRGRISSPLPLYLTEYGYETNPPDALRGVSPEEQASFIGLSTYLAWRRPDTRMFSHFLLDDQGPDGRYPADSPRRWRGYQTGLYFQDGAEKPALRAFKLPFWAEVEERDGGPFVVLFGQVRPGQGPQRVAIEQQDPSGTWRVVDSVARAETPDPPPGPCDRAGEFQTDTAGFYLRAVPFDGERAYRPRWVRPDGGVEHGLPVTAQP